MSNDKTKNTIIVQPANTLTGPFIRYVDVPVANDGKLVVAVLGGPNDAQGKQQLMCVRAAAYGAIGFEKYIETVKEGTNLSLGVRPGSRVSQAGNRLAIVMLAPVTDEGGLPWKEAPADAEPDNRLVAEGILEGCKLKEFGEGASVWARELAIRTDSGLIPANYWGTSGDEFAGRLEDGGDILPGKSLVRVSLLARADEGRNGEFKDNPMTDFTVTNVEVLSKDVTKDAEGQEPTAPAQTSAAEAEATGLL